MCMQCNRGERTEEQGAKKCASVFVRVCRPGHDGPNTGCCFNSDFFFNVWFCFDSRGLVSLGQCPDAARPASPQLLLRRPT